MNITAPTDIERASHDADFSLRRSRHIALADRLGNVARHALNHCRSGGVDRTPSAAQFSVVLGCVNARFTFTEVEQLFAEEHAGTERYRRRHKRNPAAARRHLQAELQRARNLLKGRVVVDDRNSARAALTNVAAHIDANDWMPRDRNLIAVLRALVAVANRAGRVAGFHASRGQLADLAGVSERSVARALRRAEAEAWVYCQAPSTTEHAATWAFRPTRQTAPPRQQEHVLVGVNRGGKTARTCWSDDIWRPAGLGHAAGYVADALTSEPATPTELAEGLNYASAGSVRRHLLRLEAVGLAQHTRHGWIRGTATAAQAAETARCTGESQWYREQHRRKRRTQARRYGRPDGRHMFVVRAAPQPALQPAQRLPRWRYAYAYAWGYRTVTTYDDNGYLIRAETPPAPHRVADDIAA